jgi:hypothetical protein
MLARGKRFHDNGATSAAAVLADPSTWQPKEQHPIPLPAHAKQPLTSPSPMTI